MTIKDQSSIQLQMRILLTVIIIRMDQAAIRIYLNKIIRKFYMKIVGISSSLHHMKE